MQGRLKIHRKIEARERYTDANVFRVFFHLLIKANHKDGKRQGQVVKRGQVIIGRDSLSEQLGISVQQVRTALEKLEGTGEITKKATNKFSIVTLVNYGIYNDLQEESNQQDNQQITNNQPTSNQQITTNKNNKNEKKNKNEELYNQILLQWNSRQVVVHNVMSPAAEKIIKKRLTEYTIEQLLTAINNYADIYHDKDGRFSYKRTLAEFMQRDNALPVFLHKTTKDYKKSKTGPTIPDTEPPDDMGKAKLYVEIGRAKYQELFGQESTVQANKLRQMLGLENKPL